MDPHSSPYITPNNNSPHMGPIIHSPMLSGCRAAESKVKAGPILGGSWVVLCRVISRITKVITYFRGLATPLITTYGPPSTCATETPHS